MKWALAMVEHLAIYLCVPIEARVGEALEVGRGWSEGRVGTGEAIASSRAVHRHARGIEDPVYKLFCRSVGQAVATAHMADHSLGPIYYGHKLMKLLDQDAEKEGSWQLSKLQELCPELVPVIKDELPKLI